MCERVWMTVDTDVSNCCVSDGAHTAIAKATDLIMTDLPIVYRPPPDFTLLRTRNAIKHVFDSEQRKVRRPVPWLYSIQSLTSVRCRLSSTSSTLS